MLCFSSCFACSTPATTVGGASSLPPSGPSPSSSTPSSSSGRLTHLAVRPAALRREKKPKAPHFTVVSFISWVPLSYILLANTHFPSVSGPEGPLLLPPPCPVSPPAPGCKACCVLTRFTLGIFPQLSTGAHVLLGMPGDCISGHVIRTSPCLCDFLTSPLADRKHRP